MKTVYFKSFCRRKVGLPLEISTLDPTKHSVSTSQTLREVLEQRIISPNTRHHALPNRLSVSLPTPDFPGVYRPEGILFATDNPLTYCVPFDLMALTNGSTYTSHDYGSDFLLGFQDFVFQDFRSMTDSFSNSKLALEALNAFRESHGLAKPNKKMDYNEICFENDITIEPLGLIGTSSEISGLSWDHKIKRYDSMDQYIMAKDKPVKYFLQELFYKALPYMFDACQGLAQER